MGYSSHIEKLPTIPVDKPPHDNTPKSGGLEAELRRNRIQKRKEQESQKLKAQWEWWLSIFSVLLGFLIIIALVKTHPEAVERILSIESSDITTENIFRKIQEFISLFF